MITDERLDELFRDWARAEVGGTQAPLSGPSAEPIELVAPTPAKVTRRIWLVAAAVVLLALSSVGWLAFGARDDAAPPAATISDLYGHWVYVPIHQGIDIAQDSIIFWGWSCALKDTYALAIDSDHLTVGDLVSGGYACTGVPHSETVSPPGTTEQPVRASTKAFRRVVFSQPYWQIVDGRLVLTSPDGESITLDR